MAIKVKELKDDAIINVPTNKSYYLMMKAVSFYLVKQIGANENPDAYLKEVLTKKYEELDELQRSFYTIALFLAQVESSAQAENLYDEKEVLEPGDEGYVEPTQD